MRTIKLTTGAEVPLDGDLMTVIESLYLEMTAKRELEHFAEYDYLVVNDNLDTALKELSSIYVAARCTRARREHYGHALLAEARSRDGGAPSSSQ